MMQKEKEELIKKVNKAIRGIREEKKALKAAENALNAWDKETGVITLYPQSKLASLVKTLRQIEKAASN